MGSPRQIERHAEIDRLLSDAAGTNRVPGVVAMAADGAGVIYAGAFGRRSLPDGAPMSLDTVFWIASMTKAITAVAAMQLVESGRLDLDRPAREWLPQLDRVRVIERFDAEGRPVLRAPRRAITLRHLLTHTSGFSEDVWHADLRRYAEATGHPTAASGRLAALDAPLVCDPGERWEYGLSLDWVGRLVEAVSGRTLDAYFRDQIFAPLGMSDTGYVLQPEAKARCAAVHRRKPDGALERFERPVPATREYFPGGGALYSTAGDYLTFLRMLLANGSHAGVALLRPETVRMMAQNQIGEIDVGGLRPARPELSNDVEFFPGMTKKWGLSFLINTRAAPSGRSAGSLAWAGLGNTYYWLDPHKRVTGLLLTQVLPFGDPAVLQLFTDFETAVYALAGAGTS